ncbi:MAG: hypothetical protein DRI90_23665, partial [Deltaproteobacteria bacterium]
LGLPPSYPIDVAGELVQHPDCQCIGRAVKQAALRGVRARSARVPDGAGRELAWFPTTQRSRARLVEIEPFERWYWG